MTDHPASAGDLQVRDSRGRFVHGRSGNPKGRERGSRNRATLLAQRLVEADVEGIVGALVAKALDGDVQAGSVLLSRLLPPQRERCVEIELPSVVSSAQLPAALAAVVRAVASGELSPAEGERLGRLLLARASAAGIAAQSLDRADAQRVAEAIADETKRQLEPLDPAHAKAAAEAIREAARRAIFGEQEPPSLEDR